MEGRETDGESERELSFIPLEDILVYKIICPPSQSPLLFLPARRKKKSSRLSNTLSDCLFSFWKTVLPSRWGQLLRTIVGLFRYLLCRCCECVDAHQCVHCLDGNNNYRRCLWLEHSLSNVHRWARDCIARDMLFFWYIRKGTDYRLWSAESRLLCPSEMWCVVVRKCPLHGTLLFLLPSFPFTSTITAFFLSSDGHGCVSEEKTTF